jgi:hypothetical protein
MAEVAARPRVPGPIALLGGRDLRYGDLLDGVEAALGETGGVYRWDATRASRHTMLRGLRVGPALAVYAGHGTSGGWAAYGGVAGRDLSNGHPLGSLICLTCRAAARPRARRSFAEEVVAAGGAAAVFAAIEDVPHAEHSSMAEAFASALNRGASTLGDLVRDAGLRATTLERYRIVGDPGAPLAAEAGAAEACARIVAPAPGDAIPPLPAGWWPQEEVRAASSGH